MDSIVFMLQIPAQDASNKLFADHYASFAVLSKTKFSIAWTAETFPAPKQNALSAIRSSQTINAVKLGTVTSVMFLPQ